MGVLESYESYDALALAELVVRGEVSPGELLDAAIARVEERDPGIGSVVTKMYDRARAAIDAGLPDGPLCGVPFLLKDLLTCYAGVPTTNGCRLFADFTPDHDSDLVTRYKRAGLVIFGKTATPEFGLTTTTESRLFGVTRNPWNREYIAGASSGGAAAAVAAGLVPAADASDGGGSIRVPASCCGLFGLKAARGRLPAGPELGERWSGMGTAGTITRSVRDCAAFLDATAGPARGDPYCAPPQERPFVREVGAHVAPLRIAFQVRAFNGVETHPDCVAAVEDAAKLCTELGHQVEEGGLSVDAEALSRATGVIIAANTRVALDRRAGALGRSVEPEDVEHVTYVMYTAVADASAADYADALRTIHGLGRQVAEFFERYDVLLTPTMATPPLKLGGALSLSSPDLEEFVAAVRLTVGYTQLFNAAGNPAMSVPLYWNANNLPIGVQFAASYGSEALLLRLGAQLESARPWAERRPAL